MTAADVRARLTHALRLDLIGPEPEEPQASEVLAKHDENYMPPEAADALAKAAKAQSAASAASSVAAPVAPSNQ